MADSEVCDAGRRVNHGACRLDEYLANHNSHGSKNEFGIHMS